jgi:hypothetical protein
MHKMKLHEVIIQGKYRIIRVPGGWIYERQVRKITSTDSEVELVFVPLNDEFNGST